MGLFLTFVRFKQHSKVNLSGVRILLPSPPPLILGLLVYALNFLYICYFTGETVDKWEHCFYDRASAIVVVFYSRLPEEA